MESLPSIKSLYWGGENDRSEWRGLYLRNVPLTKYVKLRVAYAPGMLVTFFSQPTFKGNRYLAIPACITALAWRLSDEKPMGFLPETGHAWAVMPVGMVHAQPAILRMWQEAHGGIAWLGTHFLTKIYVSAGCKVSHGYLWQRSIVWLNIYYC